MLKAIEQARKQHKQAIEEILYEDCCNVIEYQSVKDPVTKQTVKKEVIVLPNQPCDLTYSKPQSANGTDTVSTVSQMPLLIISKDINIKAGSKIVVTRESNIVVDDSIKTIAYKNSSAPAYYSTHQEITLELFKSWT